MITTKVTDMQLAEWQDIYLREKDSLRPNRISGRNLNEYFKSRHAPSQYDDGEFREIVYQSAKDVSDEKVLSDIATYQIGDNVFVGIDLRSGYFHVESGNIEESVPVWDDLFVQRGLNEALIPSIVKRDATHLVQA